MIMEIGIVAGDIWHYLDENNGSAKLAKMSKSLGKPKEELLMSLPYLFLTC